jgi:hypothetical protein
MLCSREVGEAETIRLGKQAKTHTTHPKHIILKSWTAVNSKLKENSKRNEAKMKIDATQIYAASFLLSHLLAMLSLELHPPATPRIEISHR